MILKSSIVLFFVLFAAGVLGGKKASSPKAAQGNDQDEYARENGNGQSPSYYDNENQNVNNYGQSGQDGYYGQNTPRLPGNQHFSIGNGRKNTNVVSISDSEPSYIVGYTSHGDDYDNDQYNYNRGQQYPSSKGNSFITVNQRPGRPDTVLLSSKSKNGQKSTLLVTQDGININPDPSYNNYPNNNKRYNGQQNYNPKGFNHRQGQDYQGRY
ncbi:GATA zinc finger domain-containing protein 14-like isoform X2 [Zerene cesonia]|uniref:GATA zinc finger domain-containing protein 14-like isoform X2 n=1 Tax=Zerene cesonia TaxID=33412 RepID=UPI0018E54F45|nr:GATA zinc finger domain-containing protein 14-like isoform X2 [Zerene cesonia]